MTAFGFWNIDSLRDRKTDKRDLPRIAAKLAIERSLDVLFLLECKIPYTSLLTPFAGDPSYFPIDSAVRFKVLARFDPRFMERLPLLMPSDRFDIWHLRLPLQEEILLVLVHGLDKQHSTEGLRSLFLQEVVEELSHFEQTVGHDRSIVLGDFNLNPFEAPVASVLGMHAVITRALAERAPRRIRKRSYPHFYNPMWNLYGDEPRGSAPASYYYKGAELYWEMLDQVLLRPSLLTRFDVNTLELVTTIQGTPLTGRTGTPNRTRFSDHLPVLFQVDLSSTR